MRGLYKERNRESLATEDTENTEILFYKEKKRERDDFTKRKSEKVKKFSHRKHRKHRNFILQRDVNCILYHFRLPLTLHIGLNINYPDFLL